MLSMYMLSMHMCVYMRVCVGMPAFETTGVSLFIRRESRNATEYPYYK